MFRRKIEIPLEIEVHILIAFQLKKKANPAKGKLMGNAKYEIS